MRINFKRIDHFQICIPPGAETEARNFYIEILGLQEIPKPDYLKVGGGFWLEIADIQLHIGVENDTVSPKRHPAFEVDELEKVKSYLVDQNIRIREDRPIPDFERFSCFDPFGNRIELLGRITK
ncbi:VOC family protein [Flavilitoribacter nigricans]|uniref:Glyoxalase n=1 Tax=Flavilitoribacter nigricans (strain ATCC 23147 / DSM 23189 / NBRC 102662 / NCIMB 1420 / SS-2) TaxID=1122177 RepID=A0A2D0N7Z5_FLAN2|nr:VOC family protein [Flavilitoribacter nigricans]PHN04597.1 glyoxalase [Flavilitoribacter nigricans DSM 23189 = NBRC 102662]